MRAQGASYAAIALDLKVTKRTILNWSADGRTVDGLKREVRLALKGPEVAPTTPSPSPIVDIQTATVRIAEDGSWRREHRAISIDQLQHLRQLSDQRSCRGFDRVPVEVCRPKTDAELTPQETELVNGLLHLQVLDSRHQALRIEFLPRETA